MAHRRFGAFYARSFERRPWVTLAVANGTLGAIADTLAQTLERYQRPTTPTPAKLSEKLGVEFSTNVKDQVDKAASSWDLARTGRFFTFGVLMAPLLAEWNKFIEFRFPLRSVGAGPAAKASLTALAKRVAVDQGGL